MVVAEQGCDGCSEPALLLESRIAELTRQLAVVSESPPILAVPKFMEPRVNKVLEGPSLHTGRQERDTRSFEIFQRSPMHQSL